MTLFETINTINAVALSQPNINSVIKTGDVYDLNKDNFKQRYSAFCCTQNQHTQIGTNLTYNFTFIYVDRLTADGKNKVEIQSTGIITLGNIIRTLEELELLDAGETITYQPFTERFEAECAGVYCTIGITTAVDSCADEYQEQIASLLGDVESDSSDEYFTYK